MWYYYYYYNFYYHYFYDDDYEPLLPPVLSPLYHRAATGATNTTTQLMIIPSALSGQGRWQSNSSACLETNDHTHPTDTHSGNANTTTSVHETVAPKQKTHVMAVLSFGISCLQKHEKVGRWLLMALQMVSSPGSIVPGQSGMGD